jgi:tetratricopeptide (TPR) repeat protein
VKENRLRLIVFAAVVLVVLAVYLATMAPTAAFWDCGELIAAAYSMGVPHPPGTPFFVTIGRLFAMLPTSPEPAARITLVPVLFGAFSCGLIYLIVIKLISMFGQAERDRYRWLAHASGVFAAFACAFAFSYWDNCVEAEVYGPCVVVALSVLLFAMMWRDKVQSGTGDNRLILLSIFLLFLSTGIHFTPMMTVFAVLIFALLVDREAIMQLRVFELLAGYLIILTANEMGFNAGTLVAVGLMLAATYYGIRLMERSERALPVFGGLGLLFSVFVVGYAASGGKVMDDTVLFLASPTVAFIERWVRSPLLVVLFAAGYGGYLYMLHRQGRLNLKYVGLMLGLVFLAGAVQFIMFIRAGHAPFINEADPSNWKELVSVLKREQYDPMRLFPRKTQFLTEDDWRTNQNPRYGLLVAYFEQLKFYFRYFLWQWGNERYFDIFLHVSWQALLGLVPPLLGLWGMWHQFKKERKSFVLIFVAFLVASLGLVTYLNLKYATSDPRPQLKFKEVRERDYFYAFSFVFYTIFVGVGAYAFLRSIADRMKGRRLIPHLVSGAVVAFGFVPMLLNCGTVARRGDWIPAEYGYNMLVSCPGQHAVIFTNGDNDTFPLWFMQVVPSRVSHYDPAFGKNVRVGILSLLNTSWYCKQLKRWGAPISFSEAEIDRLPRAFAGKGNRTFLLEDIMIREMVATAGGVKLKWPEDYGSTAEEYSAKVFGNGYVPRSPVYFATTVSPRSLQDVKSHLRTEGLVYRVVADSGSNLVDIERSRYLLDSAYSMKSILDPRVFKDENTRGLLLTYAASYMAVAGEYRRLGRYSDAEQVLERAALLELDNERRMTVLYHLANSAYQSGHFDRAIEVLDEVTALGFKQPEFGLLRGAAQEGKGDFPAAEQTYSQIMAEVPNRGDVAQALIRLYLEKMHDSVKAKGQLEQWLRRVPSDSEAVRLLRTLS